MKKIVLCTAGDKKYFNVEIFKKCLKSYSENTEIEKYVFLVDEEDDNVDTFGIKKIHIPWNDIKSKNTNKCIQHGEFARYLESLEEDDKIIFTDGDIVLQRDLHDEEKDRIFSLESGTFLANYNMHLGSNMARVLQYVGADVDILLEYLKKTFSLSLQELEKYKEMNTGVLIGSKKDFIRLSELYSEHYSNLSKIITGFWNQQFLINIIVNKFFSYKDLPYEFHTHTHHSIRTKEGCAYDNFHKMGVPSIVTTRDEKFIINDTTILFAHKFI